MNIHIACIVEGHGEVEAVPILVRRIVGACDSSLVVVVPPPLRVPKNRLIRPGELEKAVSFAARTTERHGAVLILIDADDDCPATWAEELRIRAHRAAADVPLSVVLAKREFEGWFLAAARSLRGLRDLSTDLECHPDAESVRGAKEWLSAQMPPGRTYRETLDQPALTAKIDLALARSAPSFDKCWRDISRLCMELRRRAER